MKSVDSGSGSRWLEVIPDDEARARNACRKPVGTPQVGRRSPRCSHYRKRRGPNQTFPAVGSPSGTEVEPYGFARLARNHPGLAAGSGPGDRPGSFQPGSVPEREPKTRTRPPGSGGTDRKRQESHEGRLRKRREKPGAGPGKTAEPRLTRTQVTFRGRRERNPYPARRSNTYGTYSGLSGTGNPRLP
jgi:hypothetical protein